VFGFSGGSKLHQSMLSGLAVLLEFWFRLPFGFDERLNREFCGA